MVATFFTSLRSSTTSPSSSGGGTPSLSPKFQHDLFLATTSLPLVSFLFRFEVNLVYWLILMFDAAFASSSPLSRHLVVVVVRRRVLPPESADVYKRVLMATTTPAADWLMTKDYYDGT